MSEAQSDQELQAKGMPGSVTVAILGQRVLTLTSEEQTLPTGTVTHSSYTPHAQAPAATPSLSRIRRVYTLIASML